MRDVVLVTGAGGFVGSAVVRQLVGALHRSDAAGAGPAFSDGAPVGRVVAMLRPGGSPARLDELVPSSAWSVVHADLEDGAAMQAMLAEVHPRVVVHTGWSDAAHGEFSESQRSSIIDGPLRSLFSALAGVGGARIVSTGSAAVLRPGDRLDEAAAVEANPAYRAYAENKIHEERSLAALAEETGVPWVHLRLFYTFGQYEAPARLLPHLVRGLARREVVELSSGAQIRDYTDVDDVASAYLAAMRTGPERCGRTYHIGTGAGVSIHDFAHAVAEVVGRADLLRFGTVSSRDQEQPVIVADAGRARRELGWSAPRDTIARIRGGAEWWLARLRLEPTSCPS